MATLTRDALVGVIQTHLDTSADTNGLVVGRDADRILVFAPGGPFFAVSVEELQLAPKRERKAKGGTT